MHHRFSIVKQVLYALLLGAQITTLVFWASPTPRAIRTAIPSQVLGVVDVLALSALSLVEHTRSYSSSDGVNVYLLFSIAFDAVQVRSVWLRAATRVAAATTSCLALKLMLLVCETQGKRRSLLKDERDLPPESTSGVIARRFFWWLNGLMWHGYKVILKPDDLRPIKEDFAAEDLLARFRRFQNKGESVFWRYDSV